MSNSNNTFFLPSEDELFLINAAIRKDPVFAVENFNNWLKHHDFKIGHLKKDQVLPHIYDPLEIGCRKLLPMVYSNFRELQLDHPVVDQFRGYYRYTLYRNRMLNNELDILTNKLRTEGIPHYIRKGMAYLRMFYSDFGARPTSDIDIVIHKVDTEAFLQAREKEGWKSVIDWRLNSIQDSITHATTLKKSHMELDLHWRFGHHPIPSKWTDYIFSNLITYNNIETIPNELHLIDTLVHGFRFNVVRPIRWVCDASKILKSGISNWDIIIDYAKDCHVSLPVRFGLQFIKKHTLGDIPEEVLEQLDAIKDDSKTTKYNNRISTDNNNFHNIMTYSLATSKSWPIAVLKVLKHYRLIWGQRNFIQLLGNVFLITIEKAFFKKKLFLKKFRSD